jgi:hypothetical protein
MPPRQTFRTGIGHDMQRRMPGRPLMLVASTFRRMSASTRTQTVTCCAMRRWTPSLVRSQMATWAHTFRRMTLMPSTLAAWTSQRVRRVFGVGRGSTRRLFGCRVVPSGAGRVTWEVMRPPGGTAVCGVEVEGDPGGAVQAVSSEDREDGPYDTVDVVGRRVGTLSAPPGKPLTC